MTTHSVGDLRPRSCPTCRSIGTPRDGCPDSWHGCTGLSARWCPDHGSCTCPRGEYVDLSDPQCPLHGPSSAHAEGETGHRTALEAMTADRDWLRGLWEAEVAATTAVRHLHSRTTDNLCAACDLPYPCRTIRTLDRHAAVVPAPLISTAKANTPEPERVNGDGREAAC